MKKGEKPAVIEVEDLPEDLLDEVESAAVRNLTAFAASEAEPKNHAAGIELSESIDQLDVAASADVILALVREVKRRRLEMKPPQP